MAGPPTLLTFLLTLSTAPLTSAANSTYTLKTDLSHKNFFPNFALYSSADPSKGFVSYQNLSSAIHSQLIGYLEPSSSVFLGVDSTSKPATTGRASVRAESTVNFNPPPGKNDAGLLVADIKHMPASECGTWPAFWLLGREQWPVGGEIDILEGVNDDVRNSVTLHTSKGCVVDNSTTAAMGDGSGEGNEMMSSFSGTMVTDDCDVAAPDQSKNKGCSILAPESYTLSSTAGGGQSELNSQPLPSYGTPFNAAGGGVYILEWTHTSITAWFLPRDLLSSTSSLARQFNGSGTPDPKTFPISPIARFSGSGCDFTARFKDLRIIFNTAFCGEWAGQEDVWGSSCKEKTGFETCEEYVREKPEVFEEAYWEIAGLRWYEKEGGAEKRWSGRRHGREFKL
ncbi:uncharacterized protein EI97DRAFT_431731 [Westerdykella ornata]|uniref:GH16 domain-containing protein n=1 Tax=Westerdykella ornata TaxID=318751 RepID=A0A6A6JQI3_WESOR|nr:uncharacterized protein EI97DRAFT_431731 [Westerdykella ornata]KAF2278504.1 hypothetical protein EI97DRAFT_431731 [Westerdykella ornata]